MSQKEVHILGMDEHLVDLDSPQIAKTPLLLDYGLTCFEVFFCETEAVFGLEDHPGELGHACFKPNGDSFLERVEHEIEKRYDVSFIFSEEQLHQSRLRDI